MDEEHVFATMLTCFTHCPYFIKLFNLKSQQILKGNVSCFKNRHVAFRLSNYFNELQGLKYSHVSNQLI